MKRIAMVGFGALGRQLIGLMGAPPGAMTLAIFDDDLRRRGQQNAASFDDLLDDRFADFDFYVALGYLHLPLKTELLGRLRNAGRRTPPLVHPSAHVDGSASVGAGCVVYPLCSLGQNVTLEGGALLHQSVTVAHDSRIGEGAYLSPGVVLSGHVAIGRCAFLGSGVVVSNHRRVGAEARIGIGSVVTGDVPDGRSAIGNPLRLLEQPLQLE